MPFLIVLALLVCYAEGNHHVLCVQIASISNILIKLMDYRSGGTLRIDVLIAVAPLSPETSFVLPVLLLMFFRL